MNNENVYFTISVTKETAEQIKTYADFLNKRNKLRKNDFPYITDEDVIKGALYRHFDIIEKYYGFKNFREAKIPKNLKIKNRFREIAMKQGYDQSTIVKLTGIDSPNISRIFNNKNQPSIDYFIRIWFVLDCPLIEDIFYVEEKD